MHSIRKRNINSCAARWRWQRCWVWQSKSWNEFFLFLNAYGRMQEEWTICVDWMKTNGNVPTHSEGPRCFSSHLKMALAQVNLLFVHSLDSNFMLATPLIISWNSYRYGMIIHCDSEIHCNGILDCEMHITANYGEFQKKICTQLKSISHHNYGIIYQKDIQLCVL